MVPKNVLSARFMKNRIASVNATIAATTIISKKKKKIANLAEPLNPP